MNSPVRLARLRAKVCVARLRAKVFGAASSQGPRRGFEPRSAARLRAKVSREPRRTRDEPWREPWPARRMRAMSCVAHEYVLVGGYAACLPTTNESEILLLLGSAVCVPSTHGSEHSSVHTSSNKPTTQTQKPHKTEAAAAAQRRRHAPRAHDPGLGKSARMLPTWCKSARVQG